MREAHIQNNKQLTNSIISLSESNEWSEAVQEWYIEDCEEDTDAQMSCVCGKENLRYLYTIRNYKNGKTLFPIGSICIKKFNRKDLKDELSVYHDMFVLQHAVKSQEYIELTPKYFSRKLLLYLYNKNAFKPSQYNEYNSEDSYKFMLDMFNKRDKTSITPSQKNKIKAIIVSDILPFIKSKIEIKE